MQTFRDTMLVFWRQMSFALKHKQTIIFGLTQPFLFLALFGPLLTRLHFEQGAHVTNSWQVFIPGVLIQLSLFGPGYAGFAIISDKRFGVIERLRVTPASRTALLMGRVLKDVAVLFVQAILVILIGFAFGLRAPVAGILIGLLFVLVISAALASLSYALGLMVRAEDQFAGIITMSTLPNMLLAGYLLPMSLAPEWLNVVSHFTPFRYILDAVRAVFLGQYATTVVLEGAVVAVALAAVCATLGTRTFFRENA